MESQIKQIRTEANPFTTERIHAVLHMHRGNVTKAALELGISRYTLHRHMKRLGMYKKPVES